MPTIATRAAAILTAFVLGVLMGRATAPSAVESSPGPPRGSAVHPPQDYAKPLAPGTAGFRNREWRGFREVRAGVFEVERDEVVYLLDHLPQVMMQQRSVPSFVKGEVQGIHVFSLRRKAALRALGIENGDVLVSLNGSPFVEAETEFALFLELNSVDEVRLEILRGGEKRMLRYLAIETP